MWRWKKQSKAENTISKFNLNLLFLSRPTEYLSCHQKLKLHGKPFISLKLKRHCMEEFETVKYLQKNANKLDHLLSGPTI